MTPRNDGVCWHKKFSSNPDDACKGVGKWRSKRWRENAFLEVMRWCDEHRHETDERCDV